MSTVINLAEWLEKIKDKKETHIIESGPFDKNYYYGYITQKYLRDSKGNLLILEKQPTEKYLVENPKDSKHFKLFIN